MYGSGSFNNRNDSSQLIYKKSDQKSQIAMNYILSRTNPKICVRTCLVHLTSKRSAWKGRLTYMNRDQGKRDPRMVM